jgi:N-acyl-L-homoserine lactone synthetase
LVDYSSPDQTDWDSTVEFIFGTASEIPYSLYVAIAQFRYQTFVEQLEWDLPDADAASKLELDAFDTQDAVYITALDRSGDIAACARLNRTDGPYLLENVFPFLVSETPLPKSSHVWELSRLAVRRGVKMNFQLSRDIFAHSLRAAAERDASTVVGVVSLSMERFYRRLGFQLRRLGPTCVVQSDRVVACAVDPLASLPEGRAGYDLARPCDNLRVPSLTRSSEM